MSVISPEQALIRRAAGARFVDCRFDLGDPDAGRRAWTERTIAGAAYADLDRDLSEPVIPGTTGRHPLPSPEQMARRLGQMGVSERDEVIAFDDRGGPFASRLWWILRWLGHAPERVMVLDGGLGAWTGPFSSGEAPPTTEYVVADDGVNAWMRVEAPDVLARADDVVLVDARSEPRYRGEHEPQDPVAGHIPGAKNLPWAENVIDGRFDGVEAVRARVEPTLGSPAPDERGRLDVIAYCGSGVTACHDLLTWEHAGFGMGRLYVGSWSHWITDPSRPRSRPAGSAGGG